MKYVETNADNNVLYGIDQSDDVYYRTGRKNDWGPWQSTDLPQLKHLSLTSDGDILWGVTLFGDVVYQEGNSAWQYVENNGKNWIEVRVSADGSHVAGIDEAEALWDREGLSGEWNKRSGELMVISYTADGSIGWGVDYDHNVFYRAGYTDPWVQVTGKLKYITVSSDGMHVWGANSKDIIFYRNGKEDFWKSVHHGRAKQITVSGDGEHIYCVNRNDDVFYLNGYPGKFQVDKRAATNIGRPLKEVSVSQSGDNIYGIDTDNNIWHTTGINYPWIQVPGKLMSVTVVKEEELWGITPDEKTMYRANPDSSFTQLQNVDSIFIEGGGNGNDIWVATSQHILRHRAGKEADNPYFDTTISDAHVRAKTMAVSDDGNHVWYINRHNDVFYRNGIHAEQEAIPSLKLKQIAISGTGWHVWGVGEDKQVYYRVGRPGVWQEANAPLLDYMSVDEDGSTAYGVNTDTGKTYRWFC
jgi:hypothetical protein